MHQKAQLSSQIDQLSESLDQHRATLEECEREEANKQESLRMLGTELERKRGELSERLRDLEKVREKAVEEENRLSKVIYLNFKVTTGFIDYSIQILNGYPWNVPDST